MISKHPHSALVQQRGAAELPATGNWTLHRTSFVGVTTDNRQRQLAISNGYLIVTEPPNQSTLTITAEADDVWIRLTAEAVRINADTQGFSRWQLRGTVDDGVRTHELDIDIGYHGVNRRGDQAWAWFTGSATTPAPTRRFRRPRPKYDFVFDVIFDAPIHLATPAKSSGLTSARAA